MPWSMRRLRREDSGGPEGRGSRTAGLLSQPLSPYCQRWKSRARSQQQSCPCPAWLSSSSFPQGFGHLAALVVGWQQAAELTSGPGASEGAGRAYRSGECLAAGSLVPAADGLWLSLSHGKTGLCQIQRHLKWRKMPSMRAGR